MSSGQDHHEVPVPDHGLCQTVSVPLCWDLPYNRTILPNLLGHADQESAGLEVHQFYPLVQVRCSPDLRFFLCSMYVPVCTVLDRPVPPCRSLCTRARRGCEPLMNRFGFRWPDKLRCQNLPVHGAGELCVGQDPDTDPGSYPGPDLPFSCPLQLQVPPYLHYRFLGVVDCGAPCEPDGVMFFSEAELRFSRVWVGTWSGLCCVCTAFTLVTYLLEPRRLRYPERPVLFMSVCYFLVAAGHGAGVLLGGRPACSARFRPDGYRLVSQGTHDPGCTLLFVVLYFFGSAGSLWWLVLGLSWFLSAGRRWGSESIQAVSGYFHLAAWAAPALQTAGVMAAGRVEGDPLAGVCYVGTSGLVLVPQLVSLLAGFSLLLAGLRSLVRIRAAVRSRGDRTERLERLMLRIGVFGALYGVPAGAVAACLLYERASRPRWEAAWRRRTCRHLGVPCPGGSAAPLDAPHFSVFMVKYLMTMAAGVASGCWIWTRKTLRSWQRFCRRPSGEDGRRAEFRGTVSWEIPAGPR
ncbi:frizzled-7-like [Cololabis saira]|uniref:frizzled-7-like n=1 Tax=Cololabis saira TaxID=129043 RepID=UPI002AD2F9AE|nr:frizzled-7-like [Cololabis saira]